MVFNRNLLFRRSIFRCERLVSGRGTKDDDQKFHSSLGQSDCLRVSEGHIIEKNLYNQCIRISFTWQIIQNPFGKSANHHMTSFMSVELKPSRPFAEESGWIKLTFQTFWDRVFGVSPRADVFCFFCYPYERQKPSHPHRPIPLVQWCLVYEQRHHDFIPNEHLECAGVVFALPRVKNNIRSRKLTNDNEQFTIFKMYLLLIMGIFQCHVSFQGCNFRNVKQSLSEFTLDLTSKYVKTLMDPFFCSLPFLHTPEV